MDVDGDMNERWERCVVKTGWVAVMSLSEKKKEKYLKKKIVLGISHNISQCHFKR